MVLEINPREKMLIVDDSFLTAPRLYIRLYLRPLYITLVFISVHKFEGSCTYTCTGAPEIY